MSIFRTSKKSAQIAALYPVSSGARPGPARPRLLRFCTVFDISTLRVQLVAYTLYDIPNICTKLTSAIAAGKPGQGGGKIIQHRETRAEAPKKK